ncbi:MAG: family 10 glycosylhydrolase, partial [Hungatella sp.]
MLKHLWKRMVAVLCAVITLAATSYVTPAAAPELRGVWISYLVWDDLPKGQDAFQKAVDQMFENCKSWGMNAVFVHVRSHGDAMYPSSFYPWSKFATGKQGQALSYDPLAYMIQSAHARGLAFHAWFNPYRITGYRMPFEEVSEKSPAKKYLQDTDPTNDRWVLKHDGDYYYNPSVKQVKDLVIQGVMEVVNNYAVDGIHFDDYFYPELDDRNPMRWFDRPEYLASGCKTNLTQWRRDQVSELLYGVNKAIKTMKPDLLFGVSPQGYVTHLRSSNKVFADIDRWMSQDGFVDYVMPQLYWGFETKTVAGEA